MDLMSLFQEYGLFIGLTIYVVLNSQKREEQMRQREDDFILESRNREREYIKREERYFTMLETMNGKFDTVQLDIKNILNRLEGKDCND